MHQPSLHRDRHTPRMRGIQYAEASRFHHGRLWNTGSPAFAGDDNGICGGGLATRCARRFASRCPSIETEGAGKTGCALHPRSRVQWVEGGAHEHTGSAEALRHSLRKGLSAAENPCAINGIDLRCTRLCPAELLEWPAWLAMRWRGSPAVPVAPRWRRAVAPSYGPRLRRADAVVEAG